ncbi:hypothetical protein MAR_008988 [Mya arenaria]|uniref:Small ribosomal subunit protein mS23 n=1 Tax=Mya arenaria TaxID=6604 RepID=A0ABY7DY54_MYAAR|nr:hypothetical protein MAR_008988 [Mya arenaria]
MNTKCTTRLLRGGETKSWAGVVSGRQTRGTETRGGSKMLRSRVHVQSKLVPVNWGLGGGNGCSPDALRTIPSAWTPYCLREDDHTNVRFMVILKMGEVSSNLKQTCTSPQHPSTDSPFPLYNQLWHTSDDTNNNVDGLLKSEALEWKNRPLWYDVMKKFPPQVEPRMDRPVPNVHVKKILYPEDYVRAFVDEYLKRQRPGVSVEEIFQEIEEKFRSEGKRLLRKKNPVIIKSVNIEEEAKDGFDVKKLDDMS